VLPQIRKTLMLSIFAFPGAGHIFLNYRVRAIVFLSLFSVDASIIVYNIMQKAQAVADLIATRQIPIDILSINARILAQPDAFSPLILSIATWGAAIIWLVCIVDSYQLAKSQFGVDTE